MSLNTSKKLSIKVINTDDETYKKIYVGHEDEVYRNTTSPKGLVLIINNKNYKSSDPRHGSEHDLENMKSLWIKLGYAHPIVVSDLSAKDMLQEAQTFVKKPDHADSCIVVVMSHGIHDYFIGTDEKKLYIYKFYECFNSINAPNLRGKPKLFFIQACRGENIDSGVARSRDMTDVSSLVSRKMPGTTTKAEPNALRPPSSDSNPYPKELDMLMSYATPPHYVAYRNPTEGSIYIRAICRVFSKNAANDDINELLRKVRICVDAESNSPRTDYNMQTTTCDVRLAKRFYFFPGIVNELVIYNWNEAEAIEGCPRESQIIDFERGHQNDQCSVCGSAHRRILTILLLIAHTRTVIEQLKLLIVLITLAIAFGATKIMDVENGMQLQ